MPPTAPDHQHNKDTAMHTFIASIDLRFYEGGIPSQSRMHLIHSLVQQGQAQ